MVGSRALVGLAAVVVAVASGASARPARGEPGKDKVALARKTVKGERLSAKEHFRTEKVLHWKGEGQGSVGGEEAEVTEREYTQEVQAESPLAIKRDYTLSTRWKGKPKDEVKDPVRTSLHGHTVQFRGEAANLEGGEMSKEDRDNLDSYERVAYAMLPKSEVGPGDEWKLGDEIGKALFRGAFEATSMKTQGLARLDGWKTVDGRKAAKLSLKVAIQLLPTEQIPAIALELKGTALFLVEEGMYAECSLEGTMHVDVKKQENGREVAATSDERVQWKLKAEPILAAAVKPLAKDDELAKAKAVGCSKGHKFPNEFSYCATCGKGLDEKTRRCPGGCPPILRFCPLDGEPLTPAGP